MSDLDNTLLETSQPNISITHGTVQRPDQESSQKITNRPNVENQDILNIVEIVTAQPLDSIQIQDKKSIKLSVSQAGKSTKLLPLGSETSFKPPSETIKQDDPFMTKVNSNLGGEVSPSAASNEQQLEFPPKLRHQSREGKRTAMAIKVTDLNTMVQIRKKPAPKTYKDKLMHKAEKQRQAFVNKVNNRVREDKNNVPKQELTGFLLLEACNCKLPHDAKSAKLASRRITDVKEEDLVYFQRLEFLDLSDNNVSLQWLQNLTNIKEVDLQHNNIDSIQLNPDTFQHLTQLHLGYNKIPPAHLLQLSQIPNLQVLNLPNNDLCTLPSDLSFLYNLEELNLASNGFASSQTLVAPETIFNALATLPKLLKLNLSRNRLEAWHGQVRFPQLKELYFAFNQVYYESDLIQAIIQNPTLTYFVITGNPFALNLRNSTLEILLAERNCRGGQLVNEMLHPPMPSYLKGVNKIKTKAPQNQNMVNYAQSKNLVEIDENDVYNGSDPFVQGLKSNSQALAIEFNLADNDPMISNVPRMQNQDRASALTEEQMNANRQETNQGFFLTEAQQKGGDRRQRRPKKRAEDSETIPLLDINSATYANDERGVINDVISRTGLNFGESKMAVLKSQARLILGKPGLKSDEIVDNFEYKANQNYDIVATYKQLKLTLQKAQTQVDMPLVKGYLKNTIGMQQHSKQSPMNPDLLSYSLQMAQNQQHSGRAVTAANPRRNIKTTAAISYSTDQIALKQAVNEKRAGTAANSSRVPIWRKTHAQKVDEKVERMLESYWMIEQNIINEREKKNMGVPSFEDEQKLAMREKHFGLM